MIASATITPDIKCVWCPDIESKAWESVVKGAWSIAPIYLQAPLCRTILDELILPHKPTAFKMPRTKIVETSKSIAEYFDSAEDTFCVITKDALEGIIQQNADIQQKNQQKNLDIQQKYLDMQQKSMDIHQSIKESNESISRSLDLLARTVTSTHTQHQTQSNTLHKKLDDLTEAIKSRPTLTASAPEINLDSQFKYRKDLSNKIVRAESLSTYYEELLNEDSPFVRSEFRTKVNKNATESCLEHRRKQTMDNVNVEINIMRDNVKIWSERKRLIDEKLEKFISQNEDQRSVLNEKMTKQDKQCIDEFEKGFAKMKNTDAEEKNTITEFLLKTESSNEDAEFSRNYRGHPSNRGRRRPFRRY